MRCVNLQGTAVLNLAVFQSSFLYKDEKRK